MKFEVNSDSIYANHMHQKVQDLLDKRTYKESIIFQSGRQYAPEGQIILAIRTFEDEDAVFFFDFTRGVDGKILFLNEWQLNTKDVMSGYDAGNYEYFIQ